MEKRSAFTIGSQPPSPTFSAHSEAVPVEPVTDSSDGTAIRNQYRTVAGYQMDDRRLWLRGGIYDGRSWVGVVAVGKRVFCGGDDAWSPAGMYLVTSEIITDDDGGQLNVAVPAFDA